MPTKPPAEKLAASAAMQADESLATRTEATGPGALGDQSSAFEATVRPPHQAADTPSGGTLSRLRRGLPTVGVLALLGVVGYWGHRTAWKLPKFSELAGTSAKSAQDWCTAHGVPEAVCVACNADLMPKGRLHGWCREHGVAECVLEHPELAQLKEMRTVSQADLERARQALETRSRAENDPLCKLHLRRIQFVSREAADKAGIDIALVERRSIVEVIKTNGEIQYDPTRLTRLASRAAGTVWRVERNIGDQVTNGDVLALVDAVAVGRAKAELLQAVAQLELQENTYQRLADLDEGVVAGRRLQEAQAARAEAEAAVHKTVQALVNLGLPITVGDLRTRRDDLARELQFLGLPDAMALELDVESTTANLIPVVAASDGVVVIRDVVAGEVIDTSKTLFSVVDISRMWLLLDVPLEDAQYLKVGQRVMFHPDGDPHDHDGEITWISTDIDPETRTVKVRAVLPNDDGHLRNASFGAGEIVLRADADAIVAPKEAINWEGCCNVAFVRDTEFLREDAYKVFHTRMVRPGVTNGDYTEIIAGLLPGEVIVTKGSGVLRAELLKGNLAPGDCANTNAAGRLQEARVESLKSLGSRV